VKNARILLILTIIVSLLVILAVSWHSINEIHYFKSFYPAKFTVEEAFYATWVELLKVHIISLPLIVIIIISFYLLWLFGKKY
jgi:hypothetical protein